MVPYLDSGKEMGLEYIQYDIPAASGRNYISPGVLVFELRPAITW
jgi:hypothetical protein